MVDIVGTSADKHMACMGTAAVFVQVLAVDMRMDIEAGKSTNVDIF